MRLGNTDISYQNSSFLSLEKDTGLIVRKMLEDEELKKLLFYKTKDCLKQPELTQQETFSLIGKQIKIVPKAEIDPEGKTEIFNADKRRSVFRKGKIGKR